jgi:hypothetical protein
LAISVGLSHQLSYLHLLPILSLLLIDDNLFVLPILELIFLPSLLPLLGLPLLLPLSVPSLPHSLPFSPTLLPVHPFTINLILISVTSLDHNSSPCRSRRSFLKRNWVRLLDRHIYLHLIELALTRNWLVSKLILSLTHLGHLSVSMNQISLF